MSKEQLPILEEQHWQSLDEIETRLKSIFGLLVIAHRENKRHGLKNFDLIQRYEVLALVQKSDLLKINLDMEALKKLEQNTNL